MTCVVAAIGGNALVSRRDRGTERQLENIRIAAESVAELASNTLVVTHGNGPQVGRLALQAEASRSPAPLDVLSAETEGMIGYALERELRSRLPARQVVTLLTQVEVDPLDPAFERPSKPIGPRYDEETARKLADEHDWRIAADGMGWRRVVPSPRPRRVLEIEAIRVLLHAGHVVISGGGGGIPVVVGPDGHVVGVDAVVDKDLSSALLAMGVGAEALLLLTDERAVYEDWPGRRRPLRRVTPGSLRAMDLPGGSMGPKAEAAAWFVERTGGVAVIGALEDAAAMMAGRAGTRVESDHGLAEREERVP